MTKTQVWGISNCDTVRKARKWLEAMRIDHVFHDYKKEGVDRHELSRWADEAGWESLLNIRGTTFRKLDESEKGDFDRAKALRLMEEHPSLIKRPVATKGGRVLVGFTESEWENALC